MKTYKPKVLIFSGYGLNCEEETKFAFEVAGCVADIVHITDLIQGDKKIKSYDIMAFPGGFSYGDDTGSGKAYANKVRNHLMSDIEKFISEGKLIIGICNGFQILTNLGLLPGALTFNDSARYVDRWVDIQIENSDKQKSPWLLNIDSLSLPIAHGEGKYYADTKVLAALNQKNDVAARYVKGEIFRYQNLPSNPNCALEDIAGVLGYEGRVLGMMPHPERALFTTQLPNYTYLREKSNREGTTLPKYGPGLQIFKNAVHYFRT